MDNEKSNESFTTMTAAIKTWGAHTEPPKYRIETAAPIILQVASTITAGTRPHSFAVPLQLFADHNFLQPPENWLGVSELSFEQIGIAFIEAEVAVAD